MFFLSEISLPVEKNKIFGFILTSIFSIPKLLKAKICDDLIRVPFLTTISFFL